MNDTRVSKRYAAALFDVAKSNEILDAAAKDIDLIERMMSEVPYLRALLVEPLIDENRKFTVLSEVFSDRITAVTLNFLRLLIRKKRADLLDVVIADFRQLYADYNNTEEASAITAVPMTQAQLESLTISLSKMTGQTITLSVGTDPSIIGGVIVRLGDTVIDGSIRSKLERLEQHLAGHS